jgi:hypothetical protein
MVSVYVHVHVFVTEWSNCEPEYDLSNENKTATRTNEGATYVLYSSVNSYLAGGSVTFRFMDAGESSPLDGVGLAVDNQDAGTLQRENAVFFITSVIYTKENHLSILTFVNCCLQDNKFMKIMFPF